MLASPFRVWQTYRSGAVPLITCLAYLNFPPFFQTLEIEESIKRENSKSHMYLSLNTFLVSRANHCEDLFHLLFRFWKRKVLSRISPSRDPYPRYDFFVRYQHHDHSP
jgi:hypothetical protein